MLTLASEHPLAQIGIADTAILALLGYGMAAAASIPGNLVQGTVSLVLGVLLYRGCRKRGLLDMMK